MRSEEYLICLDWPDMSRTPCTGLLQDDGDRLLCPVCDIGYDREYARALNRDCLLSLLRVKHKDDPPFVPRYQLRQLRRHSRIESSGQ